MDLAAHKQRFVRMAVVDVVCLVLAMTAAIGAVKTGQDWLWVAFVAAMAVAFAAQVWFIAGFRRAQKGA